MHRRTVLGAGLAAALNRPSLVRAEAETTLKFIPYADLALLDQQALDDVPYLPLGSYYQPVAYRANLTGVPTGLVQFTGIKRA